MWWHRYNYAVGTARMAVSPSDGVVDPTLRVHGVDGLSLADLSTAPTTNGAHLMSQAFVIGQKAADYLLAGAGPKPETTTKRSVRAAAPKQTRGDGASESAALLPRDDRHYE